MDTLTIITTIIAALNTAGIVGGGMWFVKETKRQKKAEAVQVETNNAIAAGNEWQEIAEKWESANDKLNTRIDMVYMDVNVLRGQLADKISENTELKVEIATVKPRICNKPGCHDREPQTGF